MAYSAIQDEEGFWTIKDVPVFAEHTRKFKRPTGDVILKVDREWLLMALNDARVRYERDNYLAPAHVRHHDGTALERVGFFVPTCVKKARVEGEQVWCLFADITKAVSYTHLTLPTNREV